jgi:hypothetical protein
MRFWPYSIIRPRYQSSSQTTNVVGIVGYLAPELTRTRRATTCTNVFAFRAFMLEDGLVIMLKPPMILLFLLLGGGEKRKNKHFNNMIYYPYESI